MAQFGFGIGPNGQFGPMFMLTDTSDDEPETYEGHFVTEDGVPVKLVFNTADKTQADRYCSDIETKMGWKVPPPVVEGPETLASKIGTAWLAAIVIPVVVGFCIFMGLITTNMIGWIDFQSMNAGIQAIVHYGLWSVPIIGLVLTSVAIFTHSSQKLHD